VEPARQDFVHDDPNSPYVNALSYELVLFLDDLWRHINTCTAKAEVVTPVVLLTQAKIDDFQTGQILLVGQHDVLRLEVTVHQAERMHKSQTVQDGSNDTTSFLISELALLNPAHFVNQVRQPTTSEQLHAQVEVVFSLVHLSRVRIGITYVLEADDVRVLKLLKDACLGLKPTDLLRIVGLRFVLSDGKDLFEIHKQGKRLTLTAMVSPEGL